MKDGTSKSPRHTRDTDPNDPECEVRTILDRIADKWSLLVICVLADGTKRFGELRRGIDWMFPNASSGSTTGGNNNFICGGGNVPSPFSGP
jgi:HxlR-like helix-turn-helix